MTNTYYDGSTDTVIRIGRAADDYLHGETLPEGGARLEIRSYDLMLAYDLTEHGRQFLADWLHPAASHRDELRRLRNDVDAICVSLDSQSIPGAINWGDLGAAWVARVYDENGRMSLRVEIEEASPGSDALIVAVRDGLAARGWDVSNIDIATEW